MTNPANPIVERPGMASYGVPEDLTDALPWEWARQRLVGSRNYWVVTVDARNRPHSLPVWGVWLPDDSFGFSCSPLSQKVRNIRANPAVNVLADDTVEVVSLVGEASFVEGAAADALVDTYVAKYGSEPGVGGPEAMGAFVRSHAMLVVRPLRAYGVIERETEFNTRATRWRWA